MRACSAVCYSDKALILDRSTLSRVSKVLFGAGASGTQQAPREVSLGALMYSILCSWTRLACVQTANARVRPRGFCMSRCA